MTRPHVDADVPISRLELVILARLSAPKPPAAGELTRAVAPLALPAEPLTRARVIVDAALAELRARDLIDARRKLTERGSHALRAAFALARTPTWSAVRDQHLPALGLGLRAGTEEATAAVGSKEALTLAVLRNQFDLPAATTLTGLCDALLAQALGLPPGKITLNGLRAHVLAQVTHIEAKGDPEDFVPRTAAKVLKTSKVDKRTFAKALTRRWVEQTGHTLELQPGGTSTPVQASLPLPAVDKPLPLEAKPAPTEALLSAVRDTIPLVGADGRFGSEKVFVSAIWRRLARDRRVAELSLERFKRWLLSANRDGQLVLARADLVAAMDAALVADSQIEDQGATFHFVLDQRTTSPTTDRRSHAR